MIRCTQEGCTAPIDGKCLEGLELEACSHCTITDDDLVNTDIESEISEEDSVSEITQFYNVHSGDALELNETVQVTSSSLTRLILLAGLSEAGKTTMLACLFELFQSQSLYSHYTFAGSRTLIGFEKRCHLSRTKSGRNSPTTERTVRLPPKFLHLKVKYQEEFTDLLFTDISGELFKDLSNSTMECKKFEIAKRADHFVLFIDSDHLSNLTLRQAAKTRSIDILRGLIESQMLNPEAYIDVVFSKWDLLLSKTKRENHELFVSDIKKEILKKFETTHKNITFYNIASRPIDTQSLEFGYGIANLFPNWVEKTPFLYDNKMECDLNKYFYNREFSKYKYS